MSLNLGDLKIKGMDNRTRVMLVTQRLESDTMIKSAQTSPGWAEFVHVYFMHSCNTCWET